MFRKILRTVLTGMSKVRNITSALHVPKALLDACFNAVAKSSTSVEAIAFLPLPHFTSNDYDSSNFSVIFFSQNVVIAPEPLLKPLMSRISPMELSHSLRSCKKASQAEPDPSMIES
ncbi:hypothetical protein AVEN_256497-1 [Araneus ventricosus]|uniref:Uncharacterized protein n=1 Tax=Araneus ventricosus TaxID=182803 RepID=A0A4Y2NX12_ARAVE|nr:hypothetical protein AVEN_256497-1 [Araneus ventricosus]